MGDYVIFREKVEARATGGRGSEFVRPSRAAVGNDHHGNQEFEAAASLD